MRFLILPLLVLLFFFEGCSFTKNEIRPIKTKEEANQAALEYLKNNKPHIDLSKYIMRRSGYDENLKVWLFSFRDPFCPQDGANHFFITVFESGKVEFTGGR